MSPLHWLEVGLADMIYMRMPLLNWIGEAVGDCFQVDDVKTAPMDFRFPTTNQAKHCYTRYNEFHK